MPDRDFDANPYTAGERRVCDHLTALADLGCGEDPIGFLIASHGWLLEDRKKLDQIIVYYMSRNWPSYTERDRRPDWTPELHEAQSEAFERERLRRVADERSETP